MLVDNILPGVFRLFSGLENGIMLEDDILLGGPGLFSERFSCAMNCENRGIQFEFSDLIVCHMCE